MAKAKHKKEAEEFNMSPKIQEVADLVAKGKAKLVGPAVQAALDDGCDPTEILNGGMIDAMAVVGEKFKTTRSSYRRCW